MQLRTLGKSYEAIAVELGYTDGTGAYEAVMAGIKKMMKEPAEQVVTLEVKRLDEILERLLPLIYQKHPDLGAIDRILAVMARRARYLGLDAPVKVASTTADGKDKADKPDLSKLTLEELIHLKELVQKTNPREDTPAPTATPE